MLGQFLLVFDLDFRQTKIADGPTGLTNADQKQGHIAQILGPQMVAANEDNAIGIHLFQNLLAGLKAFHDAVPFLLRSGVVWSTHYHLPKPIPTTTKDYHL